MLVQHLRRYRQYLVPYYLAGILLCWLSPLAGAASHVTPPGTQLYTFGLQLFRLGEYYRAMTELKRFTLLFPHHPRQSAAQLLIGLALQEDGLLDDAFGHFQRMQQTAEEAEVHRVATFKLGELRFFQQHYRQATEHLQHFLQRFPDGPLVSHATYLLGLSWALTGQAERAQDVLETIPGPHAFADQARALQQALQTTPQEPLPSPRTAGVLAALLPGAGHLYVGKPVQALSAFLLNSLFLTGAVFAFREGLEVSGVILLYFETGWYLGNIRSAVDSARQVHHQRQRVVADHLRATYAPPVLNLEHLLTPGLGLRLTF